MDKGQPNRSASNDPVVGLRELRRLHALFREWFGASNRNLRDSVDTCQGACSRMQLVLHQGEDRFAVWLIQHWLVACSRGIHEHAGCFASDHAPLRRRLEMYSRSNVNERLLSQRDTSAAV